jgi:hypothetical protein
MPVSDQKAGDPFSLSKRWKNSISTTRGLPVTSRRPWNLSPFARVRRRPRSGLVRVPRTHRALAALADQA